MPGPAVVSRIVHGAAYHPPLLVGTGPWWERLPEDFPRRPEHFDLGMRDRAQVTASAAGDVVLRTVGACLVGSLALPFGYHPGQIRRALADRDFYGELADSGDPKRFFRDPPGRVRVETRRAGFTRFRPDDGTCYDLRFQSPFEPVNPRERSRYLRHKQNRTAHLRYWSHREGPRPTILAIHGFSADLYLLNEWFFALPWLYKIGYDVALFTLPFHGARQTRYSAFSGHGFFAGGVSRINEAFGQAVLDFRIFVDHLMQERGVPRVGVTGVSLGGFTSALLAATEPRLSFAIPNVPLVSVPDLVLEWQPIGAALRGALKALGQSLPDARRMLAVTSPLTYKPLLPRERLMVIGGVGDRLAPPKHSRLLAEHWGRCGLYWFPGSHLVHFDRGEYLRHTARFLRGIDFAHTPADLQDRGWKSGGVPQICKSAQAPGLAASPTAVRATSWHKPGNGVAERAAARRKSPELQGALSRHETCVRGGAMRLSVVTSLSLACVAVGRLAAAQSAASFPDVDASKKSAPAPLAPAPQPVAPAWAPVAAPAPRVASLPTFAAQPWAPAPGGYTMRGAPAPAPARDRVPPGYLREDRPRTGVLVAGGLTLGVPWATGLGIAAASGFPNGSGWLVAPVIGPWAALGKRSNPCDGLDKAKSFNASVSQCVAEPVARAMLVVDGVLQATGAVLLVVGSSSDSVLVRQQPTGPTLSATASTMDGHGYGLRMFGRF